MKFHPFWKRLSRPRKTPETQNLGLSAPLRFAAFGDNGSGSAAQRGLAERMLRSWEDEPFSFVLMLGDNIYPNGNVAKYGLERFVETYQPLLERGVRFWPALGNHDLGGPLEIPLPGRRKRREKANVSFFDIPGPYYDFRAGPAHIWVTDTNRFSRRQREWLSQSLAQSDAPAKIVIGHHPVYSSGWHGSQRGLLRRLKPLLEQAAVQLYLCGHEHDYERFAAIHGVTYLISGGGGAEMRAFRKPLPHSEVRESAHHFLRFEINGQGGGKMEAIDMDGHLLDQSVLPCSLRNIPNLG